MKLKVTIVLVSLFSMIAGFSQKAEGNKKLGEGNAAPGSFELKGNMPWLKNGDMLLLYTDGDKSVRDSVRMVDGQFLFTGHVQCPVGATLITVDRKFRMIKYLERGKMSITQKDSAGTIIFTGSVTDDESEELKAICSETSDKLKLALKEIRETADSALAAQKMDAIQPLFKHYTDLERNYIKEHPKSYVGLGVISKYSSTWGAKELLGAFNDLDKSVQESPTGVAIGKYLADLSNTAVGKHAKNFIQKNAKGKEVSLASFKGKYVLIDFWASWCGPCRQENPNVVKAYNTYKSKGFEVLGVSLDDNADKWKKAIKDDHLTWTQVSDLKGWKNSVALEYNISAVPANFLLDPNGVIIATNLREGALESKLAEIFKN